MDNLVKISLLGDILCDSSINLEDYKKEGAFTFCDVFASMKELLSKSDYVLANLETPISIDDSNLTNQNYKFNSPLEFASAIKEMGVDCVSTANNHCLDAGITGLFSTINGLDRIGLKHTGTTKSNGDHNYLVEKINGLKVGIISWTYGTNAFNNNNYLRFKNRKLVNLTQEQEEWFERYRVIGRFLKRWPNSIFYKAYRKVFNTFHKKNANKQVYEKNTFDWYRKLLIKKCIRQVKKKSDFIICYLHIGGQYNTQPSEYTKKTVNYFLKNGINVVVANHEHVVHGVENDIRNNKFATYSIGNFLGGSGTKYEPFNRNSDYSIVLHLYINKVIKKIDHISFSVTKSIIKGDGKYSVVPVFDYVNSLTSSEAQRVRKNALQVAYDFAGQRYYELTEEFAYNES